MTPTVAVLYPRRQYGTMPERYASWQAQSRLRHAAEVAEIVYYDVDDAASDVALDVDDVYALVVLDPLVVTPADVAQRLRTEFETRREPLVVNDRALYFCPTETLKKERRNLAAAAEGFAVATSVSVSTWRPDPVPDLEPYVPNTARSLLHVPCGDGAFGERIRQRQKCRVVGIEADRRHSAVARRRLNDVYTGDVEEVVSILEEQFDCIVAAGIIEHVADPWSLAASLRRLSTPNGVLVASIPNFATAKTIEDLNAGRFSVGNQLRYFTRAAIVELLEISGWTLETIDPMGTDDRVVTRFNVVARNQHE